MSVPIPHPISDASLSGMWRVPRVRTLQPCRIAATSKPSSTAPRPISSVHRAMPGPAHNDRLPTSRQRRRRPCLRPRGCACATRAQTAPGSRPRLSCPLHPPGMAVWSAVRPFSSGALPGTAVVVGGVGVQHLRAPVGRRLGPLPHCNRIHLRLLRVPRPHSTPRTTRAAARPFRSALFQVR